MKNSDVASQEFNRKAKEGRAPGGARMERPFTIANGEIRYRLSDRNGKKLKPVA
ncbi:hypothetical protein [Mesorhizobium sp. M1027]|uniref:hypothetical protein n=1 Tax=Mesorhizobium sp. M1027 TaxID=2957050 RepID=UPI00333D2481